MSRFAVGAILLLSCGLVLNGCGTGGVLDAGLRGGLFRGGGSIGSDEFGPPVGACCLPSGHCLTVSASDCDNYAGIFYGPGLICGIAPCVNQF